MQIHSRKMNYKKAAGRHCIWSLFLVDFLLCVGKGVAAKNCPRMARKTRIMKGWSSSRDHSDLINYRLELSKKRP